MRTEKEITKQYIESIRQSTSNDAIIAQSLHVQIELLFDIRELLQSKN